jgi:hypothetical protein
MAGDDFGKMLSKSGRFNMEGMRIQKDFDDISSIYTAHNNVLENTLKRVRDRENFLDNIADADDFDFINK